MKNYLAVFLGKPKAMDKWRAMPEAERKQREKAGIEAWHKWVADHKDAIVEMGSPLGKTKRASIRRALQIRATNWGRGRS
jgi:hypothetical protein